MHEDMQVFKQKPASVAFYSRGSRLVKFPWQSSNVWNFQKKGANHAPRSSVQIFFVIPKNFECDHTIFAYFPRILPELPKFLPEL